MTGTLLYSLEALGRPLGGSHLILGFKALVVALAIDPEDDLEDA